MVPSLRLSRDMLIRGITHKLQERAHGALSSVKRLVIGAGRNPEVDKGLIELLSEAFRARKLVLSDSNDNMNQMTRRLGMANGGLTTPLRLTYLAPDIIRKVLSGHQPVSLTRMKLVQLRQDLPHDWSEQRRNLGF